MQLNAINTFSDCLSIIVRARHETGAILTKYRTRNSASGEHQMKFNDAVGAIAMHRELHRIAGAHVVDHRRLSTDQLREGLLKVRPQYLHQETVRSNFEQALFKEESTQLRVLSRLILVDVLLNQFGFELPFDETEEMVIAFEQTVVDRSNEIELQDLGCASNTSTRFKNLKLYEFVLEVAWQNDDDKSPDEVNLLRMLRERLGISESDNRLMEAKLGKYPKLDNGLHVRDEIDEARKSLQGLGLLFAIRREDGVDVDLVPEEVAELIRNVVGTQMRDEAYRMMIRERPVRKKAHLTSVLEKNGVEYGRYDTLETLTDLVVSYVPPTNAISSNSPRYGLANKELAAWCRNLGDSSSGTTDEMVDRIIRHFDRRRPVVEHLDDERATWYEYFEELATRNYDLLRSQDVIAKDLEIESKFEEATNYLFSEKLKHTPLKQPGSNHPDGLLSLGSYYLMWDNKSKESPVSLRDHVKQFDGYMEAAEKSVPIFLVIGPAFSDESEIEAIRYRAEHFDRAITLITAAELRDLAEEWASPENKRREEPFPLGLLGVNGRYSRSQLGKIS